MEYPSHDWWMCMGPKELHHETFDRSTLLHNLVNDYLFSKTIVY